MGNYKAAIIAIALSAIACSKAERADINKNNDSSQTTVGQIEMPKNDTQSIAQEDTSPMHKIREDAKGRGIDFRAVGQEPGWLVEIDEDKRISVMADYGDKKANMPAPVKELDKQTGTLTYRVSDGTHRVSVVAEKRPCNDAMSGFPFEFTVTMTLDGSIYKGCGDYLK